MGVMGDQERAPVWHGTTILSVRRGGGVVIAGDGQVSLGPTVIKSNARKVRRLGNGAGELRREGAVHRMRRAALDQAVGGNIPERGCAADAEDHLVAIGELEQPAHPVAHATDEGADPRLAMAGAKDRPCGARLEGVDLCIAHAAWPRAEAPIGGKELLGNAQGARID